jgi:hypothetical protein
MSFVRNLAAYVDNAATDANAQWTADGSAFLFHTGVFTCRRFTRIARSRATRMSAVRANLMNSLRQYGFYVRLLSKTERCDERYGTVAFRTRSRQRPTWLVSHPNFMRPAARTVDKHLWLRSHRRGPRAVDADTILAYLNCRLLDDLE